MAGIPSKHHYKSVPWHDIQEVGLAAEVTQTLRTEKLLSSSRTTRDTGKQSKEYGPVSGMLGTLVVSLTNKAESDPCCSNRVAARSCVPQSHTAGPVPGGVSSLWRHEDGCILGSKSWNTVWTTFHGKQTDILNEQFWTTHVSNQEVCRIHIAWAGLWGFVFFKVLVSAIRKVVIKWWKLTCI